MKIAYLGAGTWGFCLARLLAGKGYRITSWARDPKLVDELNRTKSHPHLHGSAIDGSIHFTTDLQETLHKADIIVESVTAQGIRSVFEQVKAVGIKPHTPIVLTSKGIEMKTSLIVSDIILSIFGGDWANYLALISGPGFAEEIIHDLPTSLVCGATSSELGFQIAELFQTANFRVYPNSDLRGVALGGALKNIIAIACGICDGLNLGSGAKAALMTRGLHEIVKLARSQNSRPETLYGLSGMGDLFLTCSSEMSRNFRFGKLLSQGVTSDEAKQKIGMVVEGAYSATSALKLSSTCLVPMPITEAVWGIIEGKVKPKEAVKLLMQRNIKEESL